MSSKERSDINDTDDLWRDFFNLYSEIKLKNNSDNIEDLKSRLVEWLETYTNLYPGEITPYIHAFVFHIPEFIEKHGNINLFNTQGLEKLNDIITKAYHCATNRNNSNKAYLEQLVDKRCRLETFYIDGHERNILSLFSDESDNSDYEEENLPTIQPSTSTEAGHQF